MDRWGKCPAAPVNIPEKALRVVESQVDVQPVTVQVVGEREFRNAQFNGVGAHFLHRSFAIETIIGMDVIIKQHDEADPLGVLMRRDLSS